MPDIWLYCIGSSINLNLHIIPFVFVVEVYLNKVSSYSMKIWLNIFYSQYVLRDYATLDLSKSGTAAFNLKCHT